jgi:hypothetical protein
MFGLALFILANVQLQKRICPSYPPTAARAKRERKKEFKK